MTTPETVALAGAVCGVVAAVLLAGLLVFAARARSASDDDHAEIVEPDCWECGGDANCAAAHPLGWRFYCHECCPFPHEI